MGKVVEKFGLWNLAHEEDVKAGRVAPLREDCVVDTGAMITVIPSRVAQALQLPVETRYKATVTFADGRSEEREIVLGLRVEWNGRVTEGRAIIEPGRDTVLVGQLVLEDLDLLVDPKQQKVFPRNPKEPIYEILAHVTPFSRIPGN